MKNIIGKRIIRKIHMVKEENFGGDPKGGVERCSVNTLSLKKTRYDNPFPTSLGL